jgi:hypothetical protein
MVIGRVCKERAEVVCVVGGSKLICPDSRSVEQVISHHVQKRRDAERSPEQIRPLGYCRADQYPGIRSAENRDLLRVAYTFRTEPFRGPNEVLKRYLAIAPASDFVPFRPTLSATAYFRQCKEKAELNHYRYERGESGPHRSSETSIRSHEDRAVAKT